MEYFVLLVTNFADAFLIYYFVSEMVECKGKRVFFYTAVLVQCFINSYINLALGLADFKGFIFMFITASCILYILVEGQFIRVTLITIIAMTLMGIIELVTGGAMSFILKVPTAMLLEHNGFRLMGIMISKTVFFLLARYTCFKLRVFGEIKRNQYYTIILLLLFNLIIIFMAFTFYSFVDDLAGHEMFYIIGMGSGALLFNFLMLVIIGRLIEYSQNETAWKMREKEYRNHFFYTKNIEEMVNTMKAQRHDFNNFISTLLGLIQLEKYDEAKKYILSLTDEVAAVNDVADNQNPVITALINIKNERVKSNNIAFDYSIDLPFRLTIKDIDITVILGNLIDNAIEACQKIEKEKRRIYLEINTNKDMLIIKIINNKTNQEVLQKTKRFTSKVNRKDHGFGLYNIQQIVKKNNGIINIEDVGDEFKVKIALPLVTSRPE